MIYDRRNSTLALNASALQMCTLTLELTLLHTSLVGQHEDLILSMGVSFLRRVLDDRKFQG
jgi:hypothetical protein